MRSMASTSLPVYRSPMMCLQPLQTNFETSSPACSQSSASLQACMCVNCRTGGVHVTTGGCAVARMPRGGFSGRSQRADHDVPELHIPRMILQANVTLGSSRRVRRNRVVGHELAIEGHLDCAAGRFNFERIPLTCGFGRNA